MSFWGLTQVESPIEQMQQASVPMQPMQPMHGELRGVRKEASIVGFSRACLGSSYELGLQSKPQTMYHM